MLERQEGKTTKPLLGSGKLQNNPGLGCVAGTVSQFWKRPVGSTEERGFSSDRDVKVLLGGVARRSAELWCQRQ